MPKNKATIGDILEIKTPSGLAYLQYTHENHSMGSLIRILPGLYERRPADFADLARQKELYFTFYPLAYALPDRETEIVSHQPVPDWAVPYPLMRHSRGGNVWIIMRADTRLTVENLMKATKYPVLTLEQQKLSIHSLWSHSFLVQQLAQGWRPERDEEFRRRAIPEEEAKKPLAPQPKAASTESIRHYLYFPQKTGAEEAAHWFRSQGFSVDVRLGADKSWLALVKHEAVENVQDMDKLREEMEALAERLNGEYDGWEVAV